MSAHVMLDLETMGNGPLAAIVAIGAVEFGRGKILRRFYVRVTLASSLARGMVADADTVMWWMGQSGEARGELCKPGGSTLDFALVDFAAWVPNDPLVWGNGAAFDNVILSSAYRLCGRPTPWKFWNDRCYRTVKSLHPEKPLVRHGVHHNAQDDAETQAQHLMRLLPSL